MWSVVLSQLLFYITYNIMIYLWSKLSNGKVYTVLFVLQKVIQRIRCYILQNLEPQHQPAGSKAGHHLSPTCVSPCTVAKLSSLALPDSEQALSQGWQTAGRQTCSHLEQHRLWGTATARSRHCRCPVSLEFTGFFLGVTTARQTRLTQKTINVCKISPLRRCLTVELSINQDAGDHLVRCHMSLHCLQR